MAELTAIDDAVFRVEVSKTGEDINGMPAFLIVTNKQTGLRARYSIGATQRGRPEEENGKQNE